MQTIIESFSDYKPTGERGPSAKIKTANGEWCFINQDPTPLVGKTVDIDIRQPDGKRYKIGKIIKVYEATATASAQSANGNGNGAGKITWDDYRKVAEAAHELAMKFEPDEDAGTGVEGKLQIIDRSPARVGFVNNVMRAYADGRFIVPKEDDDSDDIPPF